MRLIVLCMIFCLSTSWAVAQKHQRVLHSVAGRILFEEKAHNTFQLRFMEDKTDGRPENPRLIAAVLDVTLGLFGAHRLYLGTDVKVPVFYTLTIGGGGILWIIDLGLILGSRDLEPFKNNPNIFMWVPVKNRPEQDY